MYVHYSVIFTDKSSQLCKTNEKLLTRLLDVKNHIIFYLSVYEFVYIYKT